MKKLLLTLLLTGAILPLTAAPSNALVANPGRTADVVYEPHMVKGRDYHYLLALMIKSYELRERLQTLIMRKLLLFAI